jgi:LysR family transcriptional regulator, glycine cleavage system transcriptional activator
MAINKQGVVAAEKSAQNGRKARLPPVASLQAFESAARLGNFTRAAAERHMTHGGISRHVQALEHWCGAPLFIRNGPHIKLSEAGRTLRERLSKPLLDLHNALTDSTCDAVSPLHLLTLPSIASTWLLPRLNRFIALHPNIVLTIHTGHELSSLPPSVPCVALRYGVFSRDGLSVDLMFTDRMMAVASPKWHKQFGKDPSHWPPRQMLRHTQTPWPVKVRVSTSAKGSDTKLTSQRSRNSILPRAEGIEMNDALLLLQAAELGLGVAWVRERTVVSRLEKNRLVEFPDLTQASDRAYWLAYRNELIDHPSITAFRQWIFNEIDESKD